VRRQIASRDLGIIWVRDQVHGSMEAVRRLYPYTKTDLKVLKTSHINVVMIDHRGWYLRYQL